MADASLRAYAYVMTIATASKRLATRPRLQKVVSDQWLAREEAKRAEDGHPLYRFLEWEVADASLEAFLDGLDRTLGAPIGGALTSRANRLTKGVSPRFSDYWSALDELSIATRLADSGLATRFGDPLRGEPDIVVGDGPETLLIELTAREISAELTRLQEQISDGWSWPVVARIHVSAGSYRPNKLERAEIVRRVHAAAAADPPVPLSVPIDDIVSAKKLTVFVEPGATFGYVSGVGDARWGGGDLMPALLEAIDRKRAQIKMQQQVVVGVALNQLDWDPYSWALRLAIGGSYGQAMPDIEVEPNVVGVLAFLRNIPGQAPMMAFWLKNRHAAGPSPSLLAAVLDSLRAYR